MVAGVTVATALDRNRAGEAVARGRFERARVVDEREPIPVGEGRGRRGRRRCRCRCSNAWLTAKLLNQPLSIARPVRCGKELLQNGEPGGADAIGGNHVARELLRE